jgi:tellurite resistance protein TehA-like permease
MLIEASVGFATIVNMTAFVGIPAFGQGFVVFAWTLWWIDAFISLLVGIGVPFAMFNYHNQSLETVTGAWLLPVVSPIVSAATGGIVAEYLPPAHARLTLVCSYIIWGCGFPIAVLVMAIYFQRLAVHHLPPRATIVSVFLPLGPCGQGSFALLQFAKVVRKLADDTGVGLGNGSSFDRQSQQIMALAIYAVSLPVALVIWGMGLFWLVIAVGSIIKVGLEEDRFPFNMGWW